MGEEFYSKEAREELLKTMKKPENSMRGMTEATGLAILDAIYFLTKTIREALLHGLK